MCGISKTFPAFIQNQEAPVGRSRRQNPRLRLSGGKTIALRKKPCVIKFRRYNQHQEPEQYFREMVMLYHPWRNERTEVEDNNCAQIVEANHATITSNFIKFNATELDLEAICRDYQQRQQLIEDEQDRAELVSADDEDMQNVNVFDFDDNVVPLNINQEFGDEEGVTEQVKNYTVPSMLNEDTYISLCNELNVGQRDYLMHVINCFKEKENLPFYHFISGGAGVGKSKLIEAIYQSIMRLCRSENPSVENVEVLLVAYTGKAACNIGGMTAHSAFNLPVSMGKTSRLSYDKLNSLSCQLRNLKLVVIDEISMLPNHLFMQIHENLTDVFQTRETNLIFGGKSIIVVGDFNQLAPVGGGFCFEPKGSAILVHNPLWIPFKLYELTEIMRQRDDLHFAEALTRLAKGESTAEDVQMFKSR